MKSFSLEFFQTVDERPSATGISEIQSQTGPVETSTSYPVEIITANSNSILQTIPNKFIPKSMMKKDAEKDMLLINDEI